MKNRNIIAVLVYFTSGFCLFGYIEFLSGLEPLGMNHSLYVLMAGATLLGAACVLSFFRLSWAAICALVVTALSFPLLWRQFGTTLGPNWSWVLTYHPEACAAVVSLIVSSCYAIVQLWSLVRSAAAGASERKTIWPLPVAVVYTMTTLGIANWPHIWVFCSKLRYGS